ncbi:MAG: type II toxin-antitoxin system HicB family antitoxin [Saprospiraceae bacterium]
MGSARMTLPILQAVSRINSNNYFYDKTFTLNYISKYLNFIVHNIRMKSHTYRILLNPEPEGGYTVLVPSLPGCITYGESIDHAISMAEEAIELYIESQIAHGESIPDESRTLEYSLTLSSSS